MISLEKQIACAKRELALRRNVYPNRVRHGVMNPNRADEEIAAMAAILANLENQLREQMASMDVGPPQPASRSEVAEGN